MWTEETITKQLDKWMHRNGRRLISIDRAKAVLDEPLPSVPMLPAPTSTEAVRDWLFVQASTNGNQYSIQSIVSLVSKLTKVSIKDIRGPRRFKPTVRARQIIYYVAREVSGVSFPQIGHYIGSKDHSTVMHGHRMVEKNRAYFEPELTIALNALQEQEQAA